MTNYEIIKLCLQIMFFAPFFICILNKLFLVPRVAFIVFPITTAYCFSMVIIKACLIYGYLGEHGVIADGQIMQIKRCSGYRGRGMPSGYPEYKAVVQFRTDDNELFTANIPCGSDYDFYEHKAKVSYIPMYPSTNRIISIGDTIVDINSLRWLFFCCPGVMSLLFSLLAWKSIVVNCDKMKITENGI